MTASSSTIRTVMITGANGYLASHIVKQLLEKGYNVNACVRNAANESSVRHLLQLSSSSTSSGKLQLFSTGDMADNTLYGRYKQPLANCDAVFHAATPLSPKFTGEFDGVRDMLNPGMEGTKELLETMLHSPRCSSIQCLVLTSSMSAAAPQPEPPIKNESHWSDDTAQLSRGNFYGLLKTRQEKLCQQWSEQSVQEGKLALNFRYCAICPTMIVGPPLLAADDDDDYTPSGTMGSLYRVIKPTDVPSLIGQTIKETKRKALNDSMSYIDVQDCAAQHVAAMENTNASGRYFSLVESWHWNDILSTLKELYPEISLDENYKYEGDDIIRPTQFNLDRMNSLGVKVKSIREIFAECISFFQSKGVL
uniref:NAD-dependent epimerase/dehydratase domain-containing protein n=1 Tax=Skeletonema marinoi TaxID=267567 RepID=A0A7S2LSW9_9STRA